MDLPNFKLPDLSKLVSPPPLILTYRILKQQE